MSRAKADPFVALIRKMNESPERKVLERAFSGTNYLRSSSGGRWPWVAVGGRGCVSLSESGTSGACSNRGSLLASGGVR